MENTELQIIEVKTLAALAETNRPMIADKVSKALAALSKVTVIASEEDDKFANDLLVKCGNTLPVVEGLRKEYTSKLDEWKANEMRFEGQLKDEMTRVRSARNAYANERAANARKEKDRIERDKLKDQEIGRIKADMVAAVELGVAQKIDAGEKVIVKLVNGLTLATIDQAKTALLTAIPKALNKEFFDGLVNVDYEKTLVTEEEIADLKAKALAHFDYTKQSATYVKLVSEIVQRWILKLPEKKKELEEIAKADQAKAKQLLEASKERERKEEELRKKALADKEAVVAKKNLEAKSESRISTEFKSQIQNQGIKEQDGVRKKIVYRFADEDKLINEPFALADILGKVMLHVITDKDFLGVYKRDANKFPKKDPATGLAIYLDEIQGWLDELAKIKPAPNIPGLVATEALSTIAKSTKPKA